MADFFPKIDNFLENFSNFAKFLFQNAQKIVKIMLRHAPFFFPKKWKLFRISATLIHETGSVTDRTTLIGDLRGCKAS